MAGLPTTQHDSSSLDVSDRPHSPIEAAASSKHGLRETDTNRSNNNASSSHTDVSESPESKRMWDVPGLVRTCWHKYKLVWTLSIWSILSGYFIASLVLKRKTQLSDILPFIFLYVFVSGKMLFALTGTSFITRPLKMASQSVRPSRLRRIPLWLQYLLGLSVLLSVVLAVSLAVPEDSTGRRVDRMQSLLGILVIMALLVATSKHPKSIQWRTVLVGCLLQFVLGCIVVKTRWGSDLFTWMASIASGLLGFSSYGTKFLLGDKIGGLSDVFAISVMPAIVFFAAFIEVVYYLGGMQWLLKKLGWVFQKLLCTSGAESIVAAASPFLGMSENVLLVKDYVEHMTNSELHACMTAGFATVSGSTMQGYIVLGVDAKNIITACIMSIPCSLALSKIRYPETEESLTRGVIVEPPRRTDQANILHALANGAAVGLNLSLLMAASLIAIISLVNLVDFLLTWLGQFIGIHQLTLELILGYLLYPYAWLLGVPSKDILSVSRLLGLKFITNEFVAYQQLTGSSNGSTALKSFLSNRALTIAEFALCGFGNLGSIAIQIGTLGALAPSRKADVSRLALSACITGSIATTITAAIVSMVL
ncbi:hypothetical protein GGI04_001108 [Coemansia thaxteri]|uniref:Uncharacterized protein n=1 Tax=Coemansia thaxteri TaxID=2663907 RepID=A0A9W8BNM8_9FUNG|nr:hypothetical protein H4R26_000499 [Coemansia thaxteri]KAJ2008497.1 hypothetical protein GGI04_001108 [Coemansia thaxteri]KAJ2470661.1 hypothetical protein GGI02_002778 [Coemansia sp. RSA 2322]KAJ2487275.1 hypothetical protein EV174_000612 [Coemansia sp. RSA 2320]